MDDFLKRLKKSVETGQMDGDIVDHHNAIIEKVEHQEVQKKLDNKEKNIYDSNLQEFLDVKKDTIIESDINARYMVPEGQVGGTAMINSNSEDHAMIEVLEKDNKRMREQIEKNGEMIEFLKSEIEKRGK